MSLPIQVTCTARRGPDGMGIDARSGVIVALVPGGAAEQDGLMFVGDAITAVDGIALAGQRLGNMLPLLTGASCELTLTRTDETFTQQLQCLGLPQHLTYALLGLQVRRSVAHGLGVVMQAALVREITATTSELKIGDVVLNVDGELLGPGEPLHSVLEGGRLVYTFIVARRLEDAHQSETNASNAPAKDVLVASVCASPEHLTQDSGLVQSMRASLVEELDAEAELAPATGRTEQDRENRVGQSWSSAGLVEELQVEVQMARCAVAEMVAEDALRLDRLARAVIEEDSDDERGAPRRADDEARVSASMPGVPPLQQPLKETGALASRTDEVAAARAASQAVHCLLAPPPTKSRRKVVMPTVLLAPTRFPGVVSADAYNAGTGTWCDLPASLRSSDARGEEVVWSDIPVGACVGSTTRINTNSNALDSASHALWAMIEQVLLSIAPQRMGKLWRQLPTLPSRSQAERLGDDALLIRLKAEYESRRTHVII